ncbi:MAG: hypothetical protein QOI01_2557 [Mycobacterium sp.]|nr:hypothetical protein [Mycobacterium sp.]
MCVIEVLVYGYMAGWVLTTLGLAFVAARIQDPHSPQRHRLPLALAAGAVWPLLLLGVAEYAIVAAAAAVVPDEDRALRVKL